MEIGRDLRQRVANKRTAIEELGKSQAKHSAEVSQLRNASASLDQQVQALSNALQAQADTFARLERERVEAEKIEDQSDCRSSDLTIRSFAVSLSVRQPEQQVQALSARSRPQTDALFESRSVT